MDRRQSLKFIGSGLALSLFPFGLSGGSSATFPAGLKRPSSIYITWGSHDQLSDTVELTEELAMKQLNEMIRLKSLGMKFDYFLMDMFWFDKNGGYRKFDQKNWPSGPDVWLEKCKQNDIIPGLWLSTNVMGWGNMRWMLPADEWKDSLCRNNSALCLFKGGYLAYMVQTMQMWYDKGVRLFKFDFASFDAAPDELLGTFSTKEIIELNETAWHTALKLFRLKNPEVVLMAYNGYGGQQTDTRTNFRKTVDPKWLEVFDSLYCGDPRPADVPCFNFWRSKDIYSCHMVFQYRKNGIPLERIDNTAFMIGTTGTCYYRNKQAWRGMMVLSCARGGWMNTYYGNLDLISRDDARWAAKVQDLFYPLQEFGQLELFGELPGSALPYGYIARCMNGSVITVVNPSQQIRQIEFPKQTSQSMRLLFADSGFNPQVTQNALMLGPEQMAVIGVGIYADEKYDLGTESEVIVPKESLLEDLEMNLERDAQWVGVIKPKPGYNLRAFFSLTDTDGNPLRVTGGEASIRVSIGNKLKISMDQNKRILPIRINYDKKIWSGLSWAVAELEAGNFDEKKPVGIALRSDPAQASNAKLKAFVAHVKY